MGILDMTIVSFLSGPRRKRHGKAAVSTQATSSALLGKHTVVLGTIHRVVPN